MKRRLGLLLCALLLLSGCRPAPAEEPVPPTPSPVQAPEPTPEPTPTLESWQAGYIQLIQGDGREERDKAWEAEKGFSSAEIDYLLYDVDKDGLPELFLRRLGAGKFYFDVYTCPEEDPLFAGRFYGGRLASNLYSCPRENGVLSEASRADPSGETHWWRKFTLEDGILEGAELLDEVLWWEEDEWFPAKPEDFVPGAMPLGEPTGLSSADIRPVLDYAPPLEPWQEAYRDILFYPEECGEFYAVAEHIPSENSWQLEEIAEDKLPCYFSLSDLNQDGKPELLLGLGIRYNDPEILLNILSWNEESGSVEDMDGPRTYPLMDLLFFYDTGYFGTINGAGGLYTEFWHLKDKDPDHYWYGYERSAQFNDDGELVAVKEFPFEDTNGEQLTLQEYYDLLGESAVSATNWQEATEENIQKAFSSIAGKEVP